MSKRYSMVWRNKWITAEATSIEEMAASLSAAAEELRQMTEAGVVLELDGGAEEDDAMLVTEDPEVAARFGFEEDEAFAEDEHEPRPKFILHCSKHGD